ncbi:dihydropteroate synthase [Desulfuromonas carbonis]|uniref:dihydropteroate synthase n=1 Tax=Desulfuromonas sp. DDH964 TaxID=1823759 RepID=UPI00078C2355|nr:dihydropteroate synthase [Desulfuromonas sp. DDH964]
MAPRLLTVSDESGARRELELIGCDPGGIERMAPKMLGRLVKITAVPCRAANVIKQEMLALGGDAAVARGTVACAHPATDLILIGTQRQLLKLSRKLATQPFGLAEISHQLRGLLTALNAPANTLCGRSCHLDCTRPLIMGILNLTPDSFSDGGRYLGREAALQQARQMVAEGADLIDIGGESTRPGAPAVTAEEEIERVLPVLEALARDCPLPLSVDTSKSQVARAALAAGAEFINDISGFNFDPEMAATVAAAGAGAFLMHTRGRPQTMQQDTVYGDLAGEVLAGLAASLQQARAAGIDEERLAVDPGIGFAKDVAGNLEVLRRLPEFLSLGRPLLLGTSRKAFIGRILDQPDPGRRLYGTLATVALGVAGGARIFRVHDVGPAREAALTAWAVVAGAVA